MNDEAIVYGISNCDTVKKARNWLQSQSIDFRFHDFRKDGIDENLVSQWIAAVGESVLLNRRGTTWRKLSTADQALAESDRLSELLVQHPTLIKRPVLVTGSQVQVGFKEAEYQQLFGK